MHLPALILLLIATILGVWSASLFWRAWHSGRLHRIARRKDPAAIPILSPARRRFGIVLGWMALPMAGAAFALGEMVRTGSTEAGFDPLDLAIRAAVGVMVCMAIGAVVVAIRFDPSNGRRRCGKCWYDMSATPGLRCPECGREAAAERALFRTRRAPRLLGVAALMLVSAYGLGVARGVSAHGWVAAVPTTALIVAMPWLSDKAAESGEASLAGRGWKDRMWGWQRGLLRWRCRGVLESSDNVDQIARAAILWSVVDDEDDATPKLTFQGQINVFRAFEAEIVTPRGVVPRMMYTHTMFPDTIDPRVAPAAKSALIAAMRSGRPLFVQTGIQMARFLDSEGDSLVPDLEAIVENTAIPEWTSMLAQNTLAQLAGSSQGAWEAFMRTFSSTREPIRFHAPSCVEAVLGRDTSPMLAALARSLSDPSDRVRASAAKAIDRMGESLCEWRASIAILGRDHPALAPELIERLAVECPDPDLVPAIEALLRDDHRLHQDAGVRAAASMGSYGARLLPLLRELADVEGDASRSEVILAAMEAIEEELQSDAR